MVEQVPPVVEVAIYFYCLLVGTVGISLHCWIQFARRLSPPVEDTRLDSAD